jgi:hypothetical protein
MIIIYTYRYVVKQLMIENKKYSDDYKQHTDRYHSIMIRCSCLTTII